MIPVYCISRGRALCATTPKLVPGCVLVVKQAEREAYKSSFPSSRILPTPEGSLCRDINAILDDANGEWIAILDDDLVRVATAQERDTAIDPMPVIESLSKKAAETESLIAGTRRVGGRTLAESGYNKPMTQLLIVKGGLPVRVHDCVHGRWWMDLICQIIESGGRTLVWNWVNRVFRNPMGSVSISHDKERACIEKQYLTSRYPLAAEWCSHGW